MFDEKITFDKFIRWFLVAVLVFAVLYVVNYLSHVLLPFFVAWFLAYLLDPVVKFVQYKLKVKIRAIAVIITMLLVVAVITGVVYTIVPPMIDQAEKLSVVANKYVQRTTSGNSITNMVREWIQEYQPQIHRYRVYRNCKELHTQVLLVLRADGKRGYKHHSIVHHLIIFILYIARLRVSG